MLSRPQRLSSREFDAAFSASRSFRDGLLTLRVHWRAPGERAGRSGARCPLRAAFVVPKKLGKASWRNRARRRLREAFQGQREPLQVLVEPILDSGVGGCDCIFIAGPGAHDAEFEALKGSIRALLSRAAEERRRPRGPRSSATHGAPRASGA